MNKHNPSSADDITRQDEFNPYYMRVSSLYRIGKWVLLLLFALFLTVMLLTYRDSITYENFLYLTRNLQMPAMSEGSFSSVVYEEQQNMRFAAYKGELVTAGTSGISFYDGLGALQMQDSTDCVSPVLLTGEKYLMVYDEGGTSYSMYTTIGRVYRGKTENIIQCAALSDRGVHAIASRSQEAKYCVTLYDASFRKIAQYYRDTYVTGLALQSDGERLAILGISSEGASLKGVVTVGQVGTDTAADISLGEQIPLAAAFMNNGILAVVTDGAVLFMDGNGTVKCSVSLSSMLLSGISIADTHIAVACRENTLGTSNRILVIDENGTVTGDCTFAGKVVGVTAAEGTAAVYIRGEQSVLALSKTGETVAEMAFTGNLLEICVIDGRAVFCFPAGASAPRSEN